LLAPTKAAHKAWLQALVRLGPDGTEVAQQSVERLGDALWPWAEGLQPAIAWLRAAGYLVERAGPLTPGGTRPPGSLFGNDLLKGLPGPAHRK
jgi:hypothetical protein